MLFRSPHSCRPPCGARAVNFRRSGRRWPGAVFGGLKNGRLGKARGCPGRCQPRRSGGAADRRGLCLGNAHFGPYFGLHSGSRFGLHRRRGFAGAFVRAGEVRFCGLFLRSFTGSRRACWLGCGGALPDGCVNLAFRICLSNKQIARSARGCCEVRYQNRKNLWISAAWKGFARAGCEMDAGHCAGAENEPPPCVALLPKSAPGAFAGRAGIASQPLPCAAPFSFASGYKILLIKSANIL